MANIKSTSDSNRNEKLKAAQKLINELEKGKKSGQEKGYISMGELEASLGITNN